MRGTRAALGALACGALIGIPTLARAQQQDPSTGEVTAVDAGSAHAFSVNGTDATTLTIATGGTVTFDYPKGSSFHNVDFDSAQPASCTQTAGPDLGTVPPLPAGAAPPGWSGTCTFSAAGTYAFHCDVHHNMTGTIVVRDQPTPTPTPTPSPGAGPTPTPAPTPVAVQPQSTLKGAVKLAARQRGARVRGRVWVQAAASRLEVDLWVPGRSRKLVRVGRAVNAATRAGTNAFAVPLTTKARAVLRKRRRLAVTVTVALTPPGGHTLTRTLHVTLR